MLAIAAAVLFGLELLLDLADVDRSDPFSTLTLITAGLFCLALHFAGVGTSTRIGSGRGRR